MIPDTITQVAFATGRILHAGTGKPVIGGIKIIAQEGPVVVKVLADGTFVVSGDLRRLFPDLATQDYQLHLTIQADSTQFRAGSTKRSLSVTIPMGSNFDPQPSTKPDPLISGGTIWLPADPVNLRGHVVEAKNPDVPIPDATVEVLQDLVGIPPAKTDVNGRYQFNEITVLAVLNPPKIRCSAAGFKDQERTLLIDFSKLLNEENFRLS